MKQGTSSPLGATPRPRGELQRVLEACHRGRAAAVRSRRRRAEAARVVRLDPAANRTYHYWHVFVPGVRAGQIYGYRVQGPWDPAHGLRFDPAKLLLDPYGRGVAVPEATAATPPASRATTARPR